MLAEIIHPDVATGKRMRETLVCFVGAGADHRREKIVPKTCRV